MSQPARWLWGLIPLGLLWGAGNLALDTAIERDVGLRAEQAVAAVAGTTPGARPVVAQVDGRDVTIGGEVAVLLVEHHQELVRAFADTVTVLHQGAIVTTGAPAEVAADPRVREIYQGALGAA